MTTKLTYQIEKLDDILKMNFYYKNLPCGGGIKINSPHWFDMIPL
jgi:hypothetical protein